MTRQKKERQQTHAAQQRPQQYDLAAVQGDVAGHVAVEAEQQQRREIANEKSVVLIHKKRLLYAKKRHGGGEKTGSGPPCHFLVVDKILHPSYP